MTSSTIDPRSRRHDETLHGSAAPRAFLITRVFPLPLRCQHSTMPLTARRHGDAIQPPIASRRRGSSERVLLMISRGSSAILTVAVRGLQDTDHIDSDRGPPAGVEIDRRRAPNRSPAHAFGVAFRALLAPRSSAPAGMLACSLAAGQSRRGFPLDRTRFPNSIPMIGIASADHHSARLKHALERQRLIPRPCSPDLCHLSPSAAPCLARQTATMRGFGAGCKPAGRAGLARCPTRFMAASGKDYGIKRFVLADFHPLRRSSPCASNHDI